MEAIFCPKTIRILGGLFLTPLLSPKNTSRRGLRIEVRKREEAPIREENKRPKKKTTLRGQTESPSPYHGTKEAREEKKKGEKRIGKGRERGRLLVKERQLDQLYPRRTRTQYGKA